MMINDDFMKRMVMFLSCVCLSVMLAGAQPSCEVKDLEAVISKLKSAQNCTVARVKYTGGDFQKAGGGFLWQNNDGLGWTTGERLTLKNVSKRQLSSIQQIFKDVERVQHVSQYVENGFEQRCTAFNQPRRVYAYRYDKDSSCLYVLAATPGKGCCVPSVWYCRDSVDATSKQVQRNPFAQVDSVSLRLLGLSRLWAGVKQNFVFFSRLTLDWDSVYAVNIKRVEQARSDEECTRIFQEMTALLHDGHTYVAAYSGTSVVPVTTHYIDGHVYVDQVRDLGLQRAGVARGMELLRINGEPVLEYGRRHVMPAVASSTPQWTLHATYDGNALMSCASADTVRLELSDKGKIRTVSYTPADAKPMPNVNKNEEWKKLKGNIGYLRIGSFGSRLALLDQIFPELMRTRALIIDLRGNGGGNSGHAQDLLQRLATDSFKLSSWSSPVYVPALISWGYKPQWYREDGTYVKPHAEAYGGPVVILIDRGTFSAAEDFCAIFKGMKRGIFVGTPTGGSTGNGVRLQLIPGVNYANICSKYDVGPDGTDFVGKGIQPDIVAEETYQTYFTDRVDAALSAALTYLKQL